MNELNDAVKVLCLIMNALQAITLESFYPFAGLENNISHCFALVKQEFVKKYQDLGTSYYFSQELSGLFHFIIVFPGFRLESFSKSPLKAVARTTLQFLSFDLLTKYEIGLIDNAGLALAFKISKDELDLVMKDLT